MDEWRRLRAEGDVDALLPLLADDVVVFHRSPSGTWLLARDANLVAGAGNRDRV